MVIDNHAHHVSTVMMFPVSEILEKRFSCALLFQNEYSAYVAGVSTDIVHVILPSMKLDTACSPVPSVCIVHFTLFLPSPPSLSPSLPLSLPLSLPPSLSPSLSLPFSQCVLRVILVLLTGVIVALIPNFSILMALVGSSCCTLLAFILPALFHIRLFKK